MSLHPAGGEITGYYSRWGGKKEGANADTQGETLLSDVIPYCGSVRLLL